MEQRIAPSVQIEAAIEVTTHKAWAIATQAKTNEPCADCGVIYPYWVMQLDHVPERGAKSFTVSATYTSGGQRWGRTDPRP